MDAHPVEQSESLNPASLRLCWSCGMLVREHASRCRFCGVALPNELALPPMADRAAKKLAAADTLEEESAFPHDAARKADRSFWLAQGGWVFFLLVLLSAPVLPFFCPQADVGDLAWILSFFAFCFLAHRILLSGIRWLTTPRFSQCTEPTRAARAFMNAITSGRYDYAFALLLPGDKDSTPRHHLYLPETAIFGGTFLVNTLWHFRECWRPFRWWFVFTERITLVAHRHAVVEGYALRPHPIRHQRVPWTLWLYQIGETWYIVNGAPFSGEGMLPKLYHDCLGQLHAGQLPPAEALARAAGAGDSAGGTAETGHAG